MFSSQLSSRFPVRHNDVLEVKVHHNPNGLGVALHWTPWIIILFALSWAIQSFILDLGYG
jgi:hypothetical protein